MRKPWALADQGALPSRAWVLCRLTDDAETRTCYPWGFELESLTTVYPSFVSHALTVKASKRNTGAMPFGLGNHITFDIAGGFGARMDQAQLFSPCRWDLPLKRCGLLDGHRVERRLVGVALDQVCNNVVAGYQTLEPKADVVAGALRIRVSHREVVLPGQARRVPQEALAFVFWGDRQRGFFCPEPWLGFPNGLNTGKDLIRLKPGESFCWEMQIHRISDPYLAE